jgi:CRISPR-associated protein Cmr2
VSHLLSIALGPVQEFISAGRRTGDLAAGSRLLVEIARAAAKAVQNAEGNLIFPADPDAIGPNKILAELPAANAPRVAERAKAAVQDSLRHAWRDVWAKYGGRLSRYVDATIAAAQIDGFLEFYAAWWPLDGSYPQARRSVERLLAGRKALRSFDVSPIRPGRPKSPLDPSRDCVLRADETYAVPKECRGAPLWLKPRETLDAVSLLKRLRRTDPRVPSTSLMAVRSVLAEIRDRVPDTVREMEQIAEKAEGAVDLGDLFFPERVADAARDLALDVERITDLREKAVKEVGLEEAPAYYAVLIADGDRMGMLIDSQPDAASHRRLSQALSEFAREATQAISGFDGHVVYCGGDEVLALVPVNPVIACARRLRDVFVRKLDGVRSSQATPSLSAGIAIVHHLIPLQIALEHVRSAERIAKQTRDSIAVALHLRGGAPLIVSIRWNEAGTWDEWIEAFGRGLARGVPYELAKVAREWGRAWPDSERAGRRLREETKRIFERKEGGSGRTPPAWVTDAHSLDQFASFLAVARFLSRYGRPAVSGRGHG